MIGGLAPGMHGANKSGIPFVGDSSGNLLTEVLKESKLKEKVKITNAVKCLPIAVKCPPIAVTCAFLMV